MNEKFCPDWNGFVQELKTLGCEYTVEQASDPDWCLREIAKHDYSTSLTLVTYEDGVEMANAEGFDAPHAPKESFPFYTYQLKGPHIPNRGDHSSPIFADIKIAAATALYNVLRLYCGGSPSVQ